MLAMLQPATEGATTVPPGAAVPFVVPVRFWEGDRVEDWEEPRSGWALRRGPDGVWRPLQRAGLYWLPSSRDVQFPTVFDDDVIRRHLGRSGAAESIRFAPRGLGAAEALPGRPVCSRDDMTDLPPGAEGALPFVSSRDLGGFWSLRDLVADRAGEEQAVGIPALLPLWQMREALAVMLQEQEQVEVSWHRPSGRFYARYWAYAAGDDWGVAPRLEPRTHVYVLATSGVEG